MSGCLCYHDAVCGQSLLGQEEATVVGLLSGDPAFKLQAPSRNEARAGPPEFMPEGLETGWGGVCVGVGLGRPCTRHAVACHTTQSLIAPNRSLEDRSVTEVLDSLCCALAGARE